MFRTILNQKTNSTYTNMSQVNSLNREISSLKNCFFLKSSKTDDLIAKLYNNTGSKGKVCVAQPLVGIFPLGSIFEQQELLGEVFRSDKVWPLWSRLHSSTVLYSQLS